MAGDFSCLLFFPSTFSPFAHVCVAFLARVSLAWVYLACVSLACVLLDRAPFDL